MILGEVLHRASNTLLVSEELDCLHQNTAALCDIQLLGTQCLC